MELSAIVLARVLGFVESYDLAPRGNIFYPQLVAELVKKFDFQKFPQTADETDDRKGIEFLSGRIGTRTIDKFSIFDSLLVLETRAGTDEAKRILEEMLLWGKEYLGLNYQHGMIKRFAYVSNLTFFSDAPILGEPESPLGKLGQRVGVELSKIWGDTIRYVPAHMTASYDPLTRKNPMAAFTIAKRSEHPFSENKYYSEAPLPTEIHIEILKQYEADVLTEISKK